MIKSIDVFNLVERSDCRQKVLKVDRKTHYQLPRLPPRGQRRCGASALKSPTWEPARYPITNNIYYHKRQKRLIYLNERCK